MGNCFSSERKGDQPHGYGTSSKLLVKQLKTWQATGVVGLRSCQLKNLPEQLADAKGVVRTLDASNNQLAAFPAVLADMPQLQRLTLSNNMLQRVQLGSLLRLRVLNLDGNLLKRLPDDIGQCTALEHLSVCQNKLECVPPSIGKCEKLRELHLTSNLLERLPVEIQTCCSLEVLHLDNNRVHTLPHELSFLSKLKVLILDDNEQLAGVPGCVLTSCTQLQTLSLHSTRVTREVLQATDGYDQFERRRQAKYTKAIGGLALLANSGMDEGVDVELQ